MCPFSVSAAPVERAAMLIVPEPVARANLPVPLLTLKVPLTVSIVFRQRVGQVSCSVRVEPLIVSLRGPCSGLLHCGSPLGTSTSISGPTSIRPNRAARVSPESFQQKAAVLTPLGQSARTTRSLKRRLSGSSDRRTPPHPTQVRPNTAAKAMNVNEQRLPDALTEPPYRQRSCGTPAAAAQAGELTRSPLRGHDEPEPRQRCRCEEGSDLVRDPSPADPRPLARGRDQHALFATKLMA